MKLLIIISAEKLKFSHNLLYFLYRCRIIYQRGNDIKKILKTSILVMFAVIFVRAVLADEYSNCKNSKWGADDKLGGANYVTQERTKLAATLIKQGKFHPLGITISSKTPAFPPRTLSLTVMALITQLWNI